jgi:intracellular sulfur oxidation DsrE/DsrF family protein
MAVARESKFEGQLTQVAVNVLEPGQRGSEPKLIAIIVDRRAGHSLESAAQMKHRHADVVGDPGERQGLFEAAAEQYTDVVHQPRRRCWRSGRGARRRVCGGQHAIEESHDALIDIESVEIRGAGRFGEETPLVQVSRRIDLCELESNRASFVGGGPEIEFKQCLAQQVWRDCVPIAEVAVGADGGSSIFLPLVVQSDDRWVGREGRPVAVADEDRRARKDKAVIPDGTGIDERGVADRAAERPDLDCVSESQDPVDFDASDHFQSIWRSARSYRDFRGAPSCDNLRMLRRSFFSRLTGASLLFGSETLQPTASGARGVSMFEPARHAEDDWFDALPGKHRIIFDTFMSDMFGEAVGFVDNYVSVNKTAYELGNRDIAVVLTVRHQTAPFAFNDAMWAKYGKHFSDRMKFVDPKTKQPPGSNVYTSQLAELASRGVHLAVCRLTTRAYTSIIAGIQRVDADEVFKELVANTVAPSHFVPAGIVAVSRAQERGYTLASIG